MNEIATIDVLGSAPSSTAAALVVADQSGSILRIIADAAQNPAVDVTKMQALLDMQERILAKQAEASFNQALARLTANMPRVKKNGTIKMIRKDGTDGGSIPFARWEDVDSIIRPLMRQEGFTLSFDTSVRTGEGGGAIVTGTLLHQDGHTRSASLPLPLDTGPGRNNLQAMGSTLSYGKRYTAEMLLNIVREGADDDGDKGGAEYVTDGQAAELERDLASLERMSSEENHRELFLKHMKTTRVADIRVSDFRKAKAAIAGRVARLSGAQS